MENNIEKYTNYSSKIIFAETLDQAWTAYQEYLKQIGFEKIIYLSSHFTRNKNWGNPKDTLILSNHETDYNQSLFNKQTNFLTSHPNFKMLLEEPGSETSWTKVNLEKIKDNKILPDEINGSSFTISNLSSYNVEHFNPIINPPEVAILGVGKIAKELSLDNDKNIRESSFIYLSLTFDHRALDGVPAANFLESLIRNIESI